MVRLKDIKISVKLIASFVGVALVTVLVAAVGLSGLSRLTVTMSVSQERMNALPVTARILTDISSLQSICRDAAIDADTNFQDSKVLEKDKQSFEKDVQLYHSDAARLQTADLSGEWKNKLTEAGKLYSETMEPQMNEVFRLVQSGKITEANKILQETRSVGDQILGVYTDYMNYQVSISSRDSAANNRMAQVLFAVLVLVSLAGVAVSLFLGLRISKSISKPIDELVDISRKFSKGSLHVNIQYQSKNEMGVLAASLNSAFGTLQRIVSEISATILGISEGHYDYQPLCEYPGDFKPISDAMNTILDNLNHIFHSVLESAEQVDCSSKQVSDGARELAKDASGQAGTVQELSGSILDVSEAVRQNAVRISGMASNMDIAAQRVSESDSQMKQMLSAMDAMAASSNEIDKIIKVIDNIAFQTNILALNAAVEAARAGESGKGFSVVADEVRNLAVKSAEATKQTSLLIGNSVQKVREGLGIAEKTAQALADANEKIAQINGSIREIETASQAQSVSIEQITHGVGQVSAVIQKNSATAEQSSAASQELFSQSNILKRALAALKLRTC